MAKRRIIIADTNVEYIIPLQLVFAKEFFEKVNIEIITDEAYYRELFSTPQHIDILIVSEELYSMELQRHNIDYVFVMTEAEEKEQTAELAVTQLYKYSSTMQVFNEIVGISGLIGDQEKIQEPQIVLVYSASGGTGKTTIAMGLSAALSKQYKRVLYINAARLQIFQHMLENHSPISAMEVYAKLRNAGEQIYTDIKHVIRKESFSYLPPFKSALMSIGLEYAVFGKIAQAAKKSGEYDYIVVDCDVAFDEKKAALFEIADKVIIVTNQDMMSVVATNILVSNIASAAGSEKYAYVCNDFNREMDNALVSGKVALKFAIGDYYVDHFPHCGKMKPTDLAKEESIQRLTYLV